MKFNELKIKKSGYNFSCKTRKGNYKKAMGFGLCFPGTKAQAEYFVKKQLSLDVLNYEDAEKIEAVLNKHSLYGNYELTKSQKWARLKNIADLYRALSLEYGLNKIK